MDFVDVDLERLLANLTESLGVEVKSWLDPNTVEGQAKIVRACLALRNNNGGYLVIGFDDSSLKPIPAPPYDVRQHFSQDSIQALVSKFASDRFEIQVRFVPFAHAQHPVISVPAGVRTPVAARADLKDKGGRSLVKVNAVYIRSLDSNNSASSTEARHTDWPRLTSICFDNRESDIGRFVQRHLTVERIVALRDALNKASGHTSGEPTGKAPAIQPVTDSSSVIGPSMPLVEGAPVGAVVESLLACGRKAFDDDVKARNQMLPDVGYFEVSAGLLGAKKPFTANQTFLQLVNSSIRNNSGWPFFCPLIGADRQHVRPYVKDGAWRQLVLELSGQYAFPDVDFWIISPKGLLYQARALDDDLRRDRAPGAPPTLDVVMPIWRVADAIVQALAILRAIAANPENGFVYFSFRWSRLASRTLASWSSPRLWSPSAASQEDVVASRLSIALASPDSALPAHVEEALRPLYEVFEGKEIAHRVIEDEVTKYLKA